jgi:hypothetical protein
MDKIADFYERWYATKQSCGVQFLRGTILHLSSQAHMQGEETMTVRDVIEFLEADPVEKSWEQLIASQPGDEQIRRGTGSGPMC